MSWLARFNAKHFFRINQFASFVEGGYQAPIGDSKSVHMGGALGMILSDAERGARPRPAVQAIRAKRRQETKVSLRRQLSFCEPALQVQIGATEPGAGVPKRRSAKQTSTEAAGSHSG